MDIWNFAEKVNSGGICTLEEMRLLQNLFKDLLLAFNLSNGLRLERLDALHLASITAGLRGGLGLAAGLVPKAEVG